MDHSLKKAGILVAIALAVYSLVLIGVELTTSQDFVRHYFTDIEGPVLFYAVNTTLSVTLLWATALLFLVGVACTTGLPGRSRLCWFFASQAAMFAWLGFDDRFKFHEHVAWRLDIGDHFILLSLAMLEGLLLFLLGRSEILGRGPRRFLLGGVGLFVLMIFFDACVPHDMVLRLSLEDLTKTWANVCFCGFAWQLVRAEIDDLKSTKLRASSPLST